MRFANGVGTLIACINLGDENAAIALKADSRRGSESSSSPARA